MANIAGAVGTKDKCINKTFKFSICIQFEQKKRILTFKQRAEFGIVLSYQEMLWNRSSLDLGANCMEILCNIYFQIWCASRYASAFEHCILNKIFNCNFSVV